MLTLSITLASVILVVLYLVIAYNGLVRLRQQAIEASADIDVQLKRRFDLIPNLVETVRGYAGHERTVLENVTKARTEFLAAKTPREQADADNLLTNTLKSLFAVSENYPELKANTNFLELQRELADTENKIQAARRFYNANVRDLNIRIESFPTNLVAYAFKFATMEFFETEPSPERAAVRVKF